MFIHEVFLFLVATILLLILWWVLWSCIFRFIRFIAIKKVDRILSDKNIVFMREEIKEFDEQLTKWEYDYYKNLAHLEFF